MGPFAIPSVEAQLAGCGCRGCKVTKWRGASFREQWTQRHSVHPMFESGRFNICRADCRRREPAPM